MVPGVAGSNPVIRPRNKKIAQRAFFYFCARTRIRTGEKAVRTAAKRRTEVRRLCTRTILQGDEAQRNNPVIRPRNKKSPNGRFFISVQGYGFEPRFAYSVPVIVKGYASVENVGVRLWQSGAICLRAERPHFLVIPASGARSRATSPMEGN